MTELQQVAEFRIQDLLPIGLTFTVLGIGLAYGLQVLEEQQDEFGQDACAGRSDGWTNYNSTLDQCYNSTSSHKAVGTAEFNATSDGQLGVAKITGKLPTIALVVIAAVVIGVLVRYLFRTV